MDKNAVKACDLDGTLANHSTDKPFDPEHVGEPIAPMLRRVREWLRKGEEVVIFTARAADKKNIPAIRKWLASHGLQDCRISNEKTPEIDELWDDRAITVEKNTGKILTKKADLTKDYTPSESNDGIHAMPWLDNFVREAEHDYQSQSMHGETLRPISDKSMLKTAAREVKFYRPENFDKISDINTPKMDMWAGCNDWESGWTWVGFYPKGDSMDAEGYPKEPAAWFEINHAQCPGCHGTLDGNKADGRACAEWAKKIVRKIVRAADNKALEKNGDWYEELNEDLTPFIASHSRQQTKSASAKAGVIKLTDTATINQIDNPPIPKTGPEAILHRLQNMDLDAIEKQAHTDIASGKVTRRPKAVKLLNVVEGMRRNEITPDQLMIKSVPVIPAIFRPFSVAGSTFIPGDANELYRDLFTTRDLYKETADELGDEAMGDARLQLYNAVKAVHGFGDPVNPKTATRGVSGFLQKIIGSSPKFSYFQRKLLSKPQDTVSRATITINPDLKLDEIGIPEEFAWKNYAPYIQRRMVQLGYSPGAAIKAIKDQTDEARKALVAELPHRPIIYSRAPAWHRFNTIAGKPVLTKGHTIEINPFVTTGHNADFDGDQMNIHVPSSDDAVKEAFDRLMPSKMVFSIRDPDKITPNLKHEQILSLFAASQRPAKQKVTFASREDALKAIERGDVSLSDEIEFPQPTAA